MPSIALTSIVNPDRYGANWTGVLTPPDSFTFDGGTSKILRLRPYDIDVADEVTLILNGQSVGSLPVTGNRVLGPQVEIALPAHRQIAGENQLVLVKGPPDQRWGVTDLQLVDATLGATMVIKNNDNLNAPPGDARWLSGEIMETKPLDWTWSPDELPGAADVVHFNVTDRTVNDMLSYTDIWNRAIDMQVIGGPDPDTGFRRIQIRNNLVNASGTRGQWTQEIINNITEAWDSDPELNALYPDPNLSLPGATVSFDAAIWILDGTFVGQQAEAFELIVIQEGLGDIVKRRIFYVTPAGMTNIRDAGGTQSGTAVQFNNIVRDGLQD